MNAFVLELKHAVAGLMGRGLASQHKLRHGLVDEKKETRRREK